MTTPAGAAPQEGGAQSQQPGQEPAATNEPNSQQQQGQEPAEQAGSSAPFDVTAITDPALRAQVEAQIRDAAEARREAAKYRTERNGLQQQVQQFQRANETAEQAAERQAQEQADQLAALQQENRDLKAGSAIAAAVAEAKPLNPATVTKLVKGALTYSADGAPSNLEEVMQGLRQSDPYLFRQTDAGAGAGSGPGQTPGTAGGINDFIRTGGRSAAPR